MPVVHPVALEAVIYLYPSEADALAGVKAGGSGFLVGMPSQVEGEEHMNYLYAVTNSHVITEAGSPVIRLNTVGGKLDVLPIGEDQWIHHPDGDDVAVCPINPTQNVHQFRWFQLKDFITDQIIDDYGIGPGSEAMLLGRFIDHQGHQQNRPSVRFGNLAMMPAESIEHPRGHQQESFLVEMRSIGGYSGSPVIVYYPMLGTRGGMAAQKGNPTMVINNDECWLLGVDWGHINSYEPVLDQYGNRLPDRWKVKSNSGMTGVVPAWKLRELLEVDQLRTLREEADEKKRQAKKVFTTLDHAQQDNAGGSTREQFFTDLTKVTRRVEPESDQAEGEK